MNVAKTLAPWRGAAVDLYLPWVARVFVFLLFLVSVRTSAIVRFLALER